MKYKQMHEEVEAQLDSVIRKNVKLKDELQLVKENLMESEGFIKAIEATESNLKQEVRWLRETLQLVIVDHGNVETLAGLIFKKQQEERDNGVY